MESKAKTAHHRNPPNPPRPPAMSQNSGDEVRRVLGDPCVGLVDDAWSGTC